MKRHEIISTVGLEFLKENIETGEFSYAKALGEIGKNYLEYVADGAARNYKDIDLRFVQGKLTVLIETKQRLTDSSKEANMEQLQQYVTYEKELTGNKIIAILASTITGKIHVWQDGSDKIDDEHEDVEERVIRPMSEYKNIHFGTRNDKISVIQSTYALNELLHNYGIGEKIRSQFVGTCLLALKNDLEYKRSANPQVRAGIEHILERLLDNDLNKAAKLVILKNKVIESQDVRDLKDEEFHHILRYIEVNIMPYINEKSTMGQDLLNLFFTTFNKYVGKSDKNQAFTPDHIVHFMSQVVGINRNSVILDPCCGSGSFLVRAMTEALDDCDTEEERINIKENQIIGIEYEDTAFGLSTTNMLIHGDGNSNIIKGNCFTELDRVDTDRVNTVLMNPPYNAQRKHSDPEYVEGWASSTKEDPSKGFHFVYHTAEKVKTGKLAVLLPMQCATGVSGEVKRFKEKMLEKHTLDAVFSLPSDIFHPGANAVACCMIFNLGTRHEDSRRDTFFGYFKNDGHEKRKNLGRVEKEDGLWQNIEERWLELYFNRQEEQGLSVNKRVAANDEWLAEAYMEIDYSQLTEENFEFKIRDFISSEALTGNLSISNFEEQENNSALSLDEVDWDYFYVDQNSHGDEGLFIIEEAKGETTLDLIEGNEIPYIAAKKNINGLKSLAARDENEEYISRGNGIVFVSLGEGSAGYATYQPREFIGMSGKIKVGYNPNMNTGSGIFIATILDLERPKYSFGRSWTGKKLHDTKVYLPIDDDGNPNWQFMEDYIKSLPFGEFID